MTVQKTIMDPNLIVFVDQIIEAKEQGWEIDRTNPPEMLGFCYHVIMLHEGEPPVKLTRAEILAKARAAKVAKAASEPSEDADATLTSPTPSEATGEASGAAPEPAKSE